MGGASRLETLWGFLGPPCRVCLGLFDRPNSRVRHAAGPLCRCAAGPTASTAKHASEHCEQTNFLLTEAASCRIDLLCRDAGRTPRSLLRQVDAPNPRSRIVFLEAVREDT